MPSPTSSGAHDHGGGVAHGRSSRLPTIGAAAASALMHAAPLAFLLLTPTAHIYGVSSKPSDDVSLETLVTVNVEVLDTIDEIKPPAAAIDQVAVPAAPPSPEVSDPKDGVEQSVQEEPRPEKPQVEPDERPSIPPPSIASLETTEPADIQRQEPVAPPEAETRQAATKPPTTPMATPPPAPSLAPSVASQGPAPGAPGSQKATASRGELIAYAGLIRGRLAKRKPRTRGHVGTVVVAFGIDRLGSVSFASIEKKSGVAILDLAALKAVRDAGPFPPPPDGRDHAFVLPFEFR